MFFARQQAHYTELLALNALALAEAQAASSGASTKGSLQIEALAATFTNTPLTGSPVPKGGTIKSFLITMGQTNFGVGESVVLTLKKNGTSILTANITLNNGTGAATQLNELADLSNLAVAIGDEFTLSGVYTAGGAPNHPDFGVNLAWG